MPTTQTLLERDTELASLDALIGEAREGRARLALVEGPAGIGKSRLLAELRRRAGGEGFRVLSARGSELEREFPFGVVRQLFEPLLADPEEREGMLSGSAASAASVFSAPGEQEAGGDPSFAALHGLFWLTLDLAEKQPLLLAIDDLHWADASSLRFLAYLARRLEGLEVLVGMTMRPAEPGADAALLAEIANDPLTSAIRPRPLSGPAVAEIVRARLGAEATDPFCSACHETTGGNPLLLEELLRALESEGTEPTAANVGAVTELGPRAASRSVLVRLARLPSEAVAVAHAVAVLGEGAELEAITGLTGLDMEQAAEATGALARAEILRPETPLGFVHPLVRAAVYGDLPPGERELRHREAADRLRELGAPPEQVAAHLLAIPPRGEEWVADVLHRAGRAATVKGAADSAAAYLRRALEEPPPPERRTRVVFELGMVEGLFDAPKASEHLREAYERLDDPPTKSLAANLLARTLMMTGREPEAQELTQRAMAAIPDEDDVMRQALEALSVCIALFGSGDMDEVRAGLRRHRDSEPGGLGWKFLAAMTALDWTYEAAPADDCCRLALQALEGGDLIAADSGLICFGAINTLVFADRPEAEAGWEELLRVGHERGSLFGISGLHMWQGHALARRGELAEAEELLLEAKEEFELYGYASPAHTYLRAFLSACRLDRGDVALARRTLDEAEDPGIPSDSACFWLYAKIRVLLAEGRDEEVIAAADELARRRPDTPNPVLWRSRSPKATALDRLGRRDEALPLAREEVEIARGYGGPTALGHALRVLGLIEGGEEGMERLQESVEVLDGSLARLELAESLCALGTALRHDRRPSDARDPLRRALEIAGVCGAEQVAERARGELYATGARPRRDALKGVESLTPSERRVAGLAAEGNSNREIAQELYVTPKTVEVHLSNAYRKLEIKGRRELKTALAA